MIEEPTSISSSRLNATEVSRATFAIVRRGFDTREVRSFLDHIARELESVENREAEMRRQVNEALERAKNPVIDEGTLTAALGQQSAQILRTAHEEARQVLEAAQAQATEMLQAAQARSGATAIDAERRAAARVGDAEVAASNLEQETAQASERILGQARADGEMLVARAREQGRKMVEQAQESRAAVLADMNARRRMVHLQIEQLRAARDEIARSVIGVRETVDRLTAEIAGSDAAARAAAQEVAQRQPSADLVQEEANLEAQVDAAALDAADMIDDGDESPTADATDAGVVEELFAKIRASAREDEDVDSGLAEEAPGPVGPDAEQLAERDQSIERALGALARKMKRSLQDEQNRLLDQLREGAEGDDVLADESEEVARFAAAAADPLLDAAEAGKAFAIQRGAPEGPGLSDGAVALIAESLAHHIVTPLRRRLGDALSSADPMAEVNAAFREWRGARIDRAVGDAALEAHAAAVVALVGDGMVRWATGGTGESCPDCADNALEGPVKAGSTFPTGQPFPPAHAGCRCAVLPVAATDSST